VLIFTMDSLTGYIENAKRGGPAGEILIRENLQRALVAMGAELHVAGSDEEFARLSAEPAAGQYALIFLDPWTFVGPGWIPRPFLAGRESRTFLLSFFGMEEAGHGLALDSAHILTPFPVHAKNTLLGYALKPRWRGTVTGDSKRPSRLLSDSEEAAAGLTRAIPAKKRLAVVWGKQREYFDGRWEGLARLAADLRVELHLTVAQEAMPAGIAALAPGLLVFHGHLDRDGWHTLLGESRFMLGLGACVGVILPSCRQVIPRPSPRSSLSTSTCRNGILRYPCMLSEKLAWSWLKHDFFLLLYRCSHVQVIL
jgi:hypothetical protein